MRIPCRSVAVIGGGPSGVAAAKYLEAERVFTKITIFEQRSTIGGVWNYTPQEKASDPAPVPSTDPRVGHEQPVWRPATQNQSVHQKSLGSPDDAVPNPYRETNGVSKAEPVFVSPLYSGLITNIPKQLMHFADHDFADSAQIFPQHELVRNYLAAYSQSVTDRVRFRTQVVNVKKDRVGDAQSPWIVESTPLDTTEVVREEYDAVIVASGHFATPFIPDLPGLREWQKRYPGSILHSKCYDRPDELKRKRVLVVGGSASGLDIANHIALVSENSIVLSSNHHLDKAPIKLEDNVTPHVGLVSVDPEGRTVRFADGAEEKDIDVLLFATGYLYTLPFLSELNPPVITPKGKRVQNTYEHLFYRPDPTLTFLALPQRVVPFPLAEAQASVVARIYAGRLDLPDQETMAKWEVDRIADHGDGEGFHLLPFPEDLDFINKMVDWAGEADVKEGLENDGHGKHAKRWGDKERWIRANLAALRKAFVATGPRKGSYTLLEELRLEEGANGSPVGG